METQAHEMYDKILSQLESIIGNETTWSNDLTELGKVLLGDKFIGVFSADNIPQEIYKRDVYALVNLDDSDEPGSHWIALASVDGVVHVYDSFGRMTSKILPSLKGGFIDADEDAEQHIKETNCGQRSLSWLVLFDTQGRDIALLV